MAKIPILSQNPDELKLFSKVLTPKQTKNGFKISFNTGKVSTRKKRANRVNTPGHILKELNQAIKFEDLQGWKDFANSIGVRWSVASLFIAGALKKNKMADIGELRNGLLRLGGSTGVAQAPAPTGFFNTYLRIIQLPGPAVYLRHKHPKIFTLRERDPNLKKVFRNRIITMGDISKLKISFDYRAQYAWASPMVRCWLYASEDCSGLGDQTSIYPTEPGHYEFETLTPPLVYKSFMLELVPTYAEIWHEIDNLSVKNGGIELMIDPGFEYYDRNNRGIFREQLPMWDIETSVGNVEITTHFENNYINSA